MHAIYGKKVEIETKLTYHYSLVVQSKNERKTISYNVILYYLSKCLVKTTVFDFD